MEAEILQEIETIRGYVFVMMCVVVLWALFKIIESAETIFVGFKKAWDTDFKNRMEKYQDSGQFEKIISECKGKLEKYPNHIDAVWFIAIAYYYTEQNENAKEYFEKAAYLVPTWQKSVSAYLEELEIRKQ